MNIKVNGSIGSSDPHAQEGVGDPVRVRRGSQSETFLNAAIVGGGRACVNLLQLLDQERLSRLKVKVLGVSDLDPEAPGLRYAASLNLMTTTNLRDLFQLNDLNLIIELTGSSEVRNLIYEILPKDISVIDYRAARLLWDLIQMETEKTELEKERKRYREREMTQAQKIMDSLPYRIMVVGLDMTIEAVNRTFLKEFDLTEEDVIGRSCYGVRYGFKRPCREAGKVCFLEDRLEELKEKGLYSTFKEFRDERGETRFDVVTIAPIYDEKGELVQILEASRDVTERVKLEREVQKSKTFFEMVIQSSVDGIVVVDTKGNVIIFNEGMERLTGYSAMEIIDRGHLSSFYDIETAKENMRKMRSEHHGPPGKLNPVSMIVRAKDGEEIPVTLSASMISVDGRDIGSVGIFTDMREVLKMRKELEEANLQLVQSAKIASVGRMAAGVAHEINNPLSAILIYAELLRENIEGNTQALRDLQEIVDQTLRCKKIVSELLEFSRKSAGKTSSFSLEESINKCLSILVTKANFQDISVIREFEPDLPEMIGDIGQLQQVFTNLFINAADAMEGKGVLKISLRYDPDRSIFQVKVRDTGPGIPQKYRDKIFDIFFTSKPVGKGTGLGLSISQNIIRIHGGGISFECPPEGGTVFTIELPLEYAGALPEESVFVGLDES